MNADVLMDIAKIERTSASDSVNIPMNAKAMSSFSLQDPPGLLDSSS